MDLLESVIGKTLEKVLYHEWASVEYTTLDWIQLLFSGGSSVCFNIGSDAETIDVLDDFDPGSRTKGAIRDVRRTRRYSKNLGPFGYEEMEELRRRKADRL